ncbi:DEAD/DEAH box helicase [Streptomyces sp. NPDC006997]|uniref:DEAD/DEAH box helicase n=1 Tax=Streptomyces sp. NPDC006997 TaxID=3155356 RepID=UPI0033F1C93A
MTLPVALSGTDVIGQAKTGTGKTLGFGLPLLERVTVPADVEAGRARPEDLTDAPQALVVVPTRELCTQVTNDLLTAGKVRNVRVLAIYGGRAYEPQVEALKQGVDVVVGTPGRLLDLAGQRKLDLKHVRCLVLDEADEMLDLGFLPDVEKIINMLPAKRQTMLFSATMPGAVIGLARRYMSQPTHIRATAPDDEGATVANIKQHIYRAHSMDKPEMVARILQAESRGLAMIFCRTKRTAADIADQLQRRGFAAGAVHGDLGQGAREQALRAFRNGKVDVLVCTDVAARGIDVEGVTHVINYQTPEEEKTYLHRVGRTGRAGNKGTAITLVDWDDIPRWQLINKALGLDFNDPPETYSTSAHLFDELGIPQGTKGVLPRAERTRAGLAAEELEDLGEPGARNARRGGHRGDSRPADGRSGRRERSGDAAPAAGDGDRSSRTPRRRRRMRGGAPVDATATATPAAAQSPDAVDAPEAETVPAPRTPRRRRRTRGGALSEAVPAATAAETAVSRAEGPAVLEVQPETPVATVPDDVEETAAKPRRRRTRKTAEAVEPAAPATVEIPAQATVTAEPEAVEAKPKRTRKAAATAATAEAAVDTAEGTDAKPRRTRKKATAAAAPEATEAADVADVAEEPKPRRRTRKTAVAPEAATATGTAEAAETVAEAKPKRTRKAAAATATAEAAADTAEGTDAKPRRTRKKAAAAAAPEATEATEEPKPRRTRKTAAQKATASADIPAQAAGEETEAAEAKPKRTRTRKTAEAAAPEAEAEAKPRARRTRKAAVAVESTDA